MHKNITNRVSQPVESLLKEATEQPLLTVEQEVELANRIKQGDNEALMVLYNCNLRFVVSVAKQYQNMGKSMEELIEAGKKGLELAAKSLIHSEVSNSLLMQFGSLGQAFLHFLKLQRIASICQNSL